MAPGPPAPPPESHPAPDGRTGPETWTPAHARARQLRARAFPYGGGHGERHGRGPERSPELTREAVTPRARRLAYGHRIRTQRRRRARRRGPARAGSAAEWGTAHRGVLKRAPTNPTFAAATSAAATKGWGGVSDEHAAVAAVGPLRSTEPACTWRDSGTRQTRSSSVAPSLVAPCRPQSGSGAVGRWRARACAGICASGYFRQSGAGRDSGGGAGGRRLPRPAPRRRSVRATRSSSWSRTTLCATSRGRHRQVTGIAASVTAAARARPRRVLRVAAARAPGARARGA